MYSYQKLTNIFCEIMGLLSPCCVACCVSAIISEDSGGVVAQLNPEVSVRLVVLADISALALRGFSCLNFNCLRPPAQ